MNDLAPSWVLLERAPERPQTDIVSSLVSHFAPWRPPLNLPWAAFGTCWPPLGISWLPLGVVSDSWIRSGPCGGSSGAVVGHFGALRWRLSQFGFILYTSGPMYIGCIVLGAFRVRLRVKEIRATKAKSRRSNLWTVRSKGPP